MGKHSITNALLYQLSYAGPVPARAKYTQCGPFSAIRPRPSSKPSSKIPSSNLAPRDTQALSAVMAGGAFVV
jgi:hypothetical protein